MSQTDVITIGKRAPKAGKALKTQQEINAAQRKGLPIEAEKKFDASRNKQHGNLGQKATKLDRETEELKHEKLDLHVSKAIQQARNSKGLTQVEFAKLINEKQHVVNEYEQAKVIPNQQILAKMERVLGVKLRGKDIGQQLPSKK